MLPDWMEFIRIPDLMIGGCHQLHFWRCGTATADECNECLGFSSHPADVWVLKKSAAIAALDCWMRNGPYRDVFTWLLRGWSLSRCVRHFGPNCLGNLLDPLQQSRNMAIRAIQVALLSLLGLTKVAADICPDDPEVDLCEDSEFSYGRSMSPSFNLLVGVLGFLDMASQLWLLCLPWVFRVPWPTRHVVSWRASTRVSSAVDHLPRWFWPCLVVPQRPAAPTTFRSLLAM